MQQHRIAPDITVLSDCAEVPGLGFLPVNTFVLHAEQPVVVDTGLSTPDKDFVSDLARSSTPPTSAGSGSPTPTATTPAGFAPCSTRRRRRGWSPRSSASGSCRASGRCRSTASTCSTPGRASTWATGG